MADKLKESISEHIKKDIEGLFGPRWEYPRHPNTEEKYATWRQTEEGKKAFHELCQIWSGYNPKIVHNVAESIVKDRDHAAAILTNPALHKSCAVWFEGITCDGARAERTLDIIYSNVISLEYALLQDTQKNLVKDPPKIQCESLDL